MLPLLLACALASAARAETPRLGLRQALEYGTERAPTLDSARRTLEIRRLERGNTFSRFLPSLDVSTSQGVTGGDPKPVTDSRFGTLSLALTETLYDNGRSFLNHRIAGYQLESAEIAWDRARNTLALDLSREFYRYSLAERLAEVRRRQLELLRKQFRSVEAQYREGLRTRRDYLRFKTQLQRAEIDVVTAENSVKLSTVEIRRIIGVPAEEKPGPSFEAVELEKNAKISFPSKAPSLDRHYESRLRRAGEEINDLQVKIARRAWLPNATLTAGAGYADPNYLQLPNQASSATALTWNVTLGLTYNIWDWGILRRGVAIADQTRDVGNNTLRASVLTAKADIEGLMLDLKRQSENLKLSRELLGFEEETFAFLDSEYRQGKVAFLDLINSLNDLLDARVRFAQAQFGALESIAEYRFHQGELYDSIVKKP
jgi:multidrug efflux system outer membrane protein